MPKYNNRPSTNTVGASNDFWSKHSISPDQKPTPRSYRTEADNTRVTPEDIAPFRGPVSQVSAADNTRVTPRAKVKESVAPLKKMEQKVQPPPTKQKEYVEPQEQLEPEYDERKETPYYKETNVLQRTADRIVDPLLFAKSNLKLSAFKARNRMYEAADRITDPLVDNAVRIIDRFKK